MTHIILLRHGETEWNSDGRVQGTLDSRLSPRGVAQSEALARALAAEPIEVIYSSDLGRTQATVAPLADALSLPVTLDSRLRERSHGILQGLTWDEIAARYPEAHRRLNAHDAHYAPPEGESAVEFRERVMAAMRDIVSVCAGQRVVVMAHGGVVGMVYRTVRDMPLEAKRDYALFNASINRFRVVEDRWFVDTWGDVSHLDGAAALDER